MNTIGDRIVSLRDNIDITQVKLAKLVGVTKATMSKYENNISIPNADIIGKIADVLNTTTDFLIGRTTDKSPINKGIDWVQLNHNELLYLNNFQLLTDENKTRIFERIEILLEEQNKKSFGSYGGTSPIIKSTNAHSMTNK